MSVTAHYTHILLGFFPFVYTLSDFVHFNKTEAKLIRFRALVKELLLLLQPCTRRALAQVGMPIVFELSYKMIILTVNC